MCFGLYGKGKCIFISAWALTLFILLRLGNARALDSEDEQQVGSPRFFMPLVAKQDKQEQRRTVP